MPLSGNRLGGKTAVVYESDSGSDYNLKIDSDLIVTGADLVAGATGGIKPLGCKLRGVHAQFIDTGKIYRKFFVCGTITGALYATNTPQVVTCDGAAFTTTGRRGEQQRFI
jgi:hypothetical protein